MALVHSDLIFLLHARAPDQGLVDHRRGAHRFGAGVLLGWLAYSSGTLVFAMIGHTIMDIGLFSYWWTQIAGTFAQRPVSETGVDGAFIVECTALVLLVAITLGSIGMLRRLQHTTA